MSGSNFKYLVAIFEGKTTTERNKIIAAAVLGLVALVALYLAFGRGIFGGSTTTAAKSPTPTPKTISTASADPAAKKMPSQEEQTFDYQTTPVEYPGNIYAPDPGRNIFAFYEPPPPPPYSPTPVPIVTPKPASPTPTPFFDITSVNPQAVYAGSSGFRMEVYGNRFTPDAHIYFSQSELPTTFINAQKLVTDIPPNFIAQEGPRQIIVQTSDGKKYSSQYIWTVQAPPRPAFQYIGMVGRKRYNNDTGYFIEQGKTMPFTARLNDVLSGRFRLIGITAKETLFEDTQLGFRHRVPITKASTIGSTTRPGNNGFPDGGGVIPGNPNMLPPDCVPGIPCNIPRYNPQPQKTPQKGDVDDNDDGDGGGG